MAFQSDDTKTQNHRLYNPYENLTLNLPSSKPIPLPISPEYLFPIESQRRSWGENLTYYTGVGYLSGATFGAISGLKTSIKSIELNDTLKLKVNRVLNGSGHAGRVYGNRCGVIGLMYAGLESGMVAVRDKDDLVNSVVAGLGTGVLYRAAKGVRSAAVAGAVGGVVVGVFVTGKQVVKRYVPVFV